MSGVALLDRAMTVLLKFCHINAFSHEQLSKLNCNFCLLGWENFENPS